MKALEAVWNLRPCIHGYSVRKLSINKTLPVFSNDAQLTKYLLDLVTTSNNKNHIETSNRYHTPHLTFSDLENIIGKVAQFENKLSRLQPKKSAIYLSFHTTIVDMLSSLESLIRKSLESKNAKIEQEQANIISFLASSLIRSLLVLDKTDEAVSILNLITKSGFVSTETSRGMLEYFSFMSNNSANNIFIASKRTWLLFDCSIRVLLWHFSHTNGKYPPLNMAALALKCIEDKSQTGIALLLYKNIIINHPQYRYDPERVSSLLQLSVRKNIFPLTSLLLEEIERANPKASNCDISELPDAELNTQKTLKDWVLCHKPSITNDPFKWKALDSFFGDKSLGQVPMNVFKRMLQIFLSKGILQTVAKNPKNAPFLSKLVLDLLRRVSLLDIDTVDSSNGQNQHQFFLNLLRASVLLKSPMIAACSIFRLNPTSLNAISATNTPRTLYSTSSKTVYSNYSKALSKSIVTKVIECDSRNVICFDFWRRAALAAGNFNLALNVLPDPESFGEIQSAAMSIDDRLTAIKLLDDKKNSFGWFHVLMFIRQGISFPSPSSSSTNIHLIEEARELNYVKSPVHWQVRLALAPPSFVWKLLEEIPTFPPSIESIEVIIPAIFKSALLSVDCFEKTVSYVEYIMSQSVSQSPSPLFTLTLKSTLLLELNSLENLLHSSNLDNCNATTVLQSKKSSFEIDLFDADKSGPVFDVSKAYSQVSKLKLMVEMWANKIL